MPSCPAITACLGLDELEPRSHPPSHDTGSSKGFQCRATYLAISSLKPTLLAQHSSPSHPTAAASPGGPALFPPIFEMQFVFIYNPPWNIK